MARYEPVVLLSSETTCLVEDNDEVGYFDFPLKEEFCGEDVITAVDLYNKKLFLDERRKEAYAELSEEDKKFISIDEIEFFDECIVLEDDNEGDDEMSAGDEENTEPGNAQAIQTQPDTKAFVLQHIGNERMICLGDDEGEKSIINAADSQEANKDIFVLKFVNKIPTTTLKNNIPVFRRSP